jgi:hypothetical protein
MRVPLGKQESRTRGEQEKALLEKDASRPHDLLILL